MKSDKRVFLKNEPSISREAAHLLVRAGSDGVGPLNSPPIFPLMHTPCGSPIIELIPVVETKDNLNALVFCPACQVKAGKRLRDVIHRLFVYGELYILSENKSIYGIELFLPSKVHLAHRGDGSLVHTKISLRDSRYNRDAVY